MARTIAREAGFTLVELLVAIAILALVVAFVSRLTNSAASVATQGQKQIDSDSQARQLLDAMALDFVQMVKRVDVDCYAKTATSTQPGNDQIAFYSTVSGYSTLTTTQRSPVSLIAYRVNANTRFERMAKGLVWNGATTDIPIVYWATIAATFPTATTTAADTDYEEASQVFRFEYSYLLKDGSLAATLPAAGITAVAAVVVDIATIDDKSRALLKDTTTPPQIADVASRLTDFAAGMTPGAVLGKWQQSLNAITDLPRPAISGIRLYERFFYLGAPNS